MHKALYYQQTGNNQVKCMLCPHECLINEGKRGSCRVRKNDRGVLYSENYGRVTALHLDPIEKKPLYHFYPGRTILSVGTFGCNLKCRFCQNYDISQSSIENFIHLKEYTPEEIVETAVKRSDNLGIAFTYNEPGVWYEFMLDIAGISKEKNLKNVAVTNGFINKEPLIKLLDTVDAFNIDLKAFTEEFYKDYTSSCLEPVKKTMKKIRQAGKHLEITNLIIPTLNDNETVFEDMMKWISYELGKETIFHISRYFPMYRMNIHSTPISLLKRLYNIASHYLDYVYVGNVSLPSGGKNTMCPSCGKLLIRREGYFIEITGVNGGRCTGCDHLVFDNF